MDLDGGASGRSGGNFDRRQARTRGARARERPVEPSPAVRVDAEAILDLLKEAVVKQRLRPVLPETWRTNVLLDKIFVHIIREFIHRNNRRTARPTEYSGGGRRTRRSGELFARVMEDVKKFGQTEPVLSGSEKSCIAAYKEKRELGRGEYGTTYSFVDPEKDDRLALKTIHFNSTSDSRLYENVVNEVEVQRFMGEQGIAPRIHETFYCYENGGVTIMIVMDLMTVGDIDDFSATRALTDAHREIILKKVERMHELGYVHNDLHSGNVFVTEDDNGEFDFFIGDFGFVTRLPDDQASRDKLRSRDISHVEQVVSFVNRDHLRAILYGLVERGLIDVSVDMKTTHTLGAECDWDLHMYERPKV
jgi:tRNA A-37 threonylcarbamoyl transferase component Bud32